VTGQVLPTVGEVVNGTTDALGETVGDVGEVVGGVVDGLLGP
jgi:hypothetical protein